MKDHLQNIVDEHRAVTPPLQAHAVSAVKRELKFGIYNELFPVLSDEHKKVIVQAACLRWFNNHEDDYSITARKIADIYSDVLTDLGL